MLSKSTLLTLTPTSHHPHSPVPPVCAVFLLTCSHLPHLGDHKNLDRTGLNQPLQVTDKLLVKGHRVRVTWAYSEYDLVGRIQVLSFTGPSVVVRAGNLGLHGVMNATTATHTIRPAGLCSSRAQWPLAPNFCPQVTRKSQIFRTNHMLGSLYFTVSEHWAPFNFP